MSLSTFSWRFRGFLPAEHEFLLLLGRAKQSLGVSCCPFSGLSRFPSCPGTRGSQGLWCPALWAKFHRLDLGFVVSITRNRRGHKASTEPESPLILGASEPPSKSTFWAGALRAGISDTHNGTIMAALPQTLENSLAPKVLKLPLPTESSASLVIPGADRDAEVEHWAFLHRHFAWVLSWGM